MMLPLDPRLAVTCFVSSSYFSAPDLAGHVVGVEIRRRRARGSFLPR